jgi:hypothetical protein
MLLFAQSIKKLINRNKLLTDTIIILFDCHHAPLKTLSLKINNYTKTAKGCRSFAR